MNAAKQIKLSFPEIRALMGKYGRTQQDLGFVIGSTYQTFARKLNNETEFSMTDMLKIREFFVELGENPDDLTIERLFFVWKTHYSEAN